MSDSKDSLLHLPTTKTGLVGLALVVALDAYALYRGNENAATVMTGLICMMLGMTREQAAIATIAVRAANSAADHAQVAADVAVEAAAKQDDKLNTIEAGIKDIQDNPAMPGTPSGQRTA